MKRKFNWVLWETARLAVFFYLTVYLAGLNFHGFMDWIVKSAMLLLWLLWLFLAIRNTKRAFMVSMGAKTTMGVNGEEKSWRFSSPELTVEVDFEADTIRIAAKKASVTDKRENQETKVYTSAIDATLPMVVFHYSSREREELVTYTTYGTGTGTGTAWVGGQAVTVNTTVSVPTGGGSYYKKSGFFDLTFKWAENAKKVQESLRTERLPDGTIKSYSHVQNGFGKNSTEIVLEKVNGELNKLFDAEWSKIASKIAAREKAIDQAMLDEHHELAVKKLLAHEHLAEEVAAKAKENADAALREAGIDGALHRYNYSTSTGELIWLIGTNKVDKGLIIVGADRWAGSLSGAKAQILQDGKAYELEVELRDKEYEQANLRKRRMRLMRGQNKDMLVEWMDKINILGERLIAAQENNPST